MIKNHTFSPKFDFWGKNRKIDKFFKFWGKKSVFDKIMFSKLKFEFFCENVQFLPRK